MRNLLKIGLYVAAGYGTYEILRRTGALDKAGRWLQDNVPEDVKTKVRDHIQQARDQVQHARGQAGEQLSHLRDQASEQYQSLKARAGETYTGARDRAAVAAHRAGEQFDHAKEVVTNKWNNLTGHQSDSRVPAQPPVAEEGDSTGTTDASHATGQTITGPGRGTDDVAAEVNGGTIHHRVGRGVVHG
jgi:ElaB/YqjD/DUF883 family membrane-anchored ribosome-binding protein